MVKVSLPTTLASALAVLAGIVKAGNMNFINKCSYPIELVHSQGARTDRTCIATISTGSSFSKDVSGTGHMFSHGADEAATLLEFSFDSLAWYDISIITPNPGYCSSFQDCAIGRKRGFNVPVSVMPKQNKGKDTCTDLYCAADSETECADAYLFPMDNTKTHSCQLDTEFDITFCYADTQSHSYTQSQESTEAPTSAPAPTVTPAPTPAPTEAPTSTPAPTEAPTSTPAATEASSYTPAPTEAPTSTPAPTETPTSTPTPTQAPETGEVSAAGDYDNSVQVLSSHSYRGKDAGNFPGTYERVVSLAGCIQETISVNNKTGPLAEEVSMIFRGPMEIKNIAVFMPKNPDATDGIWKRESSYCAESGETENMVFMNNMNIDYSGNGLHSPQCYATADGLGKADEPTTFGGYLAEASTPLDYGAGPGKDTGAEVNILTEKKCDGECEGYSSENDHHGWGGGKKAFFTKVRMPQGSSPNMPAIWMLNAQVLHSNQYGCNCRNVADPGGCGELDIAEVISTGNPMLDKVSTHYYMLDESSSPGKDNFAPRRFDDFTVYCTFIDDSGDGQVSIFELADFDFTQKKLSKAFLEILRNL